jgi:uncharacterized Tic20 family protein
MGNTEASEQQSSPATRELAPEASVMWASLAHLGGVAGIIPALAIWVMLGKRSEFTESQAREAVNFQLTGLISWVALFVLTNLAVMVWREFAVFVAPGLYFALWATLASLSIMGFLTAKRPTAYRYPLALRIFS